VKRILILLLCLGLCGCATPGLIDGAQQGLSQSLIGKTKEQILWLYGSPLNWSKHIFNGKVQESWSYFNNGATFDFEDGKVVGCSQRGRYFTKDGIDDVRNYKNPFAEPTTPKS
jgi:hypothetical protein